MLTEQKPRARQSSALAREVTRTNPNLIVANANDLVLAFKAATDTIPIVATMADPVAFNIVAGLARPGGNITGVSADAGLEIWAKRLQILREAVPTASKVGYLVANLRNVPQVSAVHEAARQAGISLVEGSPASPVQRSEYQRAFGKMVQERADALIVSDHANHFTHRRLIVDLAENVRLPTIYPQREFFESGGLIAYGGSVTELYGRLAGYINQILQGTLPSELPIYQESKFQLLLNLKTAKSLGIEMPTSLLVRADEVIE
jgi:putative tryptophan/tyrosine transport system substrate-binding protein